MPKKTRSQKVIAAQRRRIRLLEEMTRSTSTEATIPSHKKTSSEQITTKIEEKFPVDEKEMAPKTFFVKDLRKSLLLIALIIALEIIVYFGTINNYFKF